MKYILLVLLLFCNLKMEAQGNYDNCHVFANLYSVTNPVLLQSINYAEIVYVDTNRSTTYYSKFLHLYGFKDDTNAFFSFELFREKKNGGLEELKFNDNFFWYQMPDGRSEKYHNDGELIKMPPGESGWYDVIRLYNLFRIKKVGKYKLIGYYKTVCNRQITLHKMKELYFDVK